MFDTRALRSAAFLGRGTNLGGVAPRGADRAAAAAFGTLAIMRFAKAAG